MAERENAGCPSRGWGRCTGHVLVPIVKFKSCDIYAAKLLGELRVHGSGDARGTRLVQGGLRRTVACRARLGGATCVMRRPRYEASEEGRAGRERGLEGVSN